MPEAGLDCEALPQVVGGSALTTLQSCEIVDGAALVERTGTRIALRAHPETGRLLMISLWDDGADLGTLATSITPRARVALPPACIASLREDILALELRVPANTWTTWEFGFEQASFVLVDRSDGNRWLRFDAAGALFRCGQAAPTGHEIVIDGMRYPVDARHGIVSACVEIHDARDPDLTQAAFVRFPDSAAGLAYATPILDSVRPAPGWTFSAWSPTSLARRWASSPGLVIAIAAAAFVVALGLAVRARRSR